MSRLQDFYWPLETHLERAGDAGGKLFGAHFRPALHIDRLKLLENGLDTIGFMLELAAMGIEPGISPALVFRATPDGIGCIGEIFAGMVKIGDLMFNVRCQKRPVALGTIGNSHIDGVGVEVFDVCYFPMRWIKSSLPCWGAAPI